MQRLLCGALALTACFADPPPVDEGSETGETSGTAGNDEGTTTSGPGTTADGSGEVSDAGATADDTESSVCGDGIVTGDEECDDQNEEDHDGCRADCRDAARELTMAMVAPPMTLIVDGPIAFSGSCLAATPALVARYFGKYGGVEPFWPISVSGACANLELVWNGGPQIVETPSKDFLEQHGDFSAPDMDWSVGCPMGTLAVGISGRIFDSGKQPPHVRAIQLHCATLTVNRDAPNGIQFETAESSPWSPGEYMDPLQMSMCGPGELLVGFRGSVDGVAAAVQNFGAECATPRVEFGPAE